MVGMEVAARDSRITSVVASNCPDRLADFLMTPSRSALFLLTKAAARVVPLRISVNHFYSYSQLIDDPMWVEIISADASISRARRLSVAAYTSLLEEWDGASTAAHVRQALLVLQGERDRLQPVEQSERVFAAAAEPKELMLIDTGHLPHLEKPEFLSDILDGWFSRTLTTDLLNGCEPLGDA
jgi:pimeloyl-ACP methyl ester carboxylesterase